MLDSKIYVNILPFLVFVGYLSIWSFIQSNFVVIYSIECAILHRLYEQTIKWKVILDPQINDIFFIIFDVLNWIFQLSCPSIFRQFSTTSL